jgi:hypothetical protein
MKSNLKEPLIAPGTEDENFFPSEQRKTPSKLVKKKSAFGFENLGNQLSHANPEAYLRKKSAHVMERIDSKKNAVFDHIEKEKRKQTVGMKYVQTTAMLLTASLSFVAASAWIDIISAQSSDAASDIPYDVACACPNLPVSQGRPVTTNCAEISYATPTEGGENCHCVLYGADSWVGRECSDKDSLKSWLMTTAFITFAYVFCYKALGIIQIITEHEVRKENGIRTAQYYAKLFELLANACGFIIAFSLLHSSRGSIRADGLGTNPFLATLMSQLNTHLHSPVWKLIFTAVLTVVCLIFKLGMENIPRWIFDSPMCSAKGYTQDRKDRFGMLNGKLFRCPPLPLLEMPHHGTILMNPVFSPCYQYQHLAPVDHSQLMEQCFPEVSSDVRCNRCDQHMVGTVALRRAHFLFHWPLHFHRPIREVVRAIS